jgi:hypothetical protein
MREAAPRCWRVSGSMGRRRGCLGRARMMDCDTYDAMVSALDLADVVNPTAFPMRVVESVAIGARGNREACEDYGEGCC